MATKNRRQFFSDTVLGEVPKKNEVIDYSNKTLPQVNRKTNTGISPYTGNFGDKELLHLLRRTLFGVKWSDYQYFKNKSLLTVLDELLTLPQNPPPPPLNHYGNLPNLNDPQVPVGETWVNATYNGTIDGARRQSFKAWWWSLLVSNDRNIREKMTLFWHNLFATETSVINDSRYAYKHNALLRANCLGNYKTLLKAITIDPAMLVYLNGNQNTKTASDENYARELQELFSVGKDLPVHYTEDDVKAAARVLTGWRDSRTNLNSFFDSTRHDTGNKQFSSFYNNAVITGKSGAAGAGEADELVDLILQHNEVANYICRKIYRFFVYYVIDESVETNVIIPLANVFRNSGYDIKITIETLLKSEHFFDALNQGCVIKPPTDHLAGLARTFNLNYPPTANIETYYNHLLYSQQVCNLLGQDLGDPPNVAGWPAYYQTPQYHQIWINSDSLPKRNQICDALLYTGYNRNGFKLMIDCIAFAQQFENVANPNLFIDDVVKLLYSVEISPTTKNTLKTAFLLSGQAQDYYWTDAWNNYLNNPSDTMAKTAVNTRLQGMFKYLLGQAEYQLI